MASDGRWLAAGREVFRDRWRKSGCFLCAVVFFSKFGETNPRFARELVCIMHRVQNIARKGALRWSGRVSGWRGRGEKSRRNGDYGISTLSDRTRPGCFGGRKRVLGPDPVLGAQHRLSPSGALSARGISIAIAKTSVNAGRHRRTYRQEPGHKGGVGGALKEARHRRREDAPGGRRTCVPAELPGVVLSAFEHRLDRTARTYLSFIGAPESDRLP